MIEGVTLDYELRYGSHDSAVRSLATDIGSAMARLGAAEATILKAKAEAGAPLSAVRAAARALAEAQERTETAERLLGLGLPREGGDAA